MVDVKEYSDEDYNKVKKRLDELSDEYSDGDGNINPISEIEINEILRDEFTDSTYDDILIDLGINDEDLGLVEDDEDDDTIGNGADEEKSKTIITTLLDGSEHVRFVEKRLKGWEKINGKMVKTNFFLIPRIEINAIILLLESLYLPQNMSSKLHLSSIEFESNMNTQLQHIKSRITNYNDDICGVGKNKLICALLLGEIQVIINAIQSGRLGDIASDMVIGSYNERRDVKPDEAKADALKTLLKIT